MAYAVDAVWMKSARAFEDKRRRVHVLTTLLILREAKRRKAPALFLFVDDGVLAPNWQEQLETISV
jgi:hypothetical protein